MTDRKYNHTVGWAVFLSAMIVCSISYLARATHNFKAALADKPDIALYILLDKQNPGASKLLRSNDTVRDYLVETDSGPMLVKLKKGEMTWYVTLTERLHE